MAAFNGQRFLCVFALAVTAPCSLIAQTLTPRAFWPAPRTTKVLSVGYSYQTGDVLTDPSLPIVRGHLVKIAASTSMVTEVGGDYTSLLLAYQRVWR